MFIGKWNKSVILTYIGLIVSIMCMILALNKEYNYALICMIIAGVCDLFDGYVARKCKRTDEEKQFGIELDSLVDTVNFGVSPIILFIGLGFTSWYNIIIFIIYLICEIARLAYFNISLDESNKNKPVKYYRGLPVTFSALIFPLVYLFSFIVTNQVFKLIYTITMLLIAYFNILNIKIPKPKGKAYKVFSIMAIIVIILYAFILK